MSEKALIEVLSDLIQLDVDTDHAYNMAIKEIDDPIIRDRLLEFQNQHRNHISGLCEQIESLGGQPPDRAKDFKGHIIEAFTAIRSFTGLKGALAAIKTVEEITNQQYGDVVSWEAPSELKEILRTYFSEEKIHLEYVDNNLQALP